MKAHRWDKASGPPTEAGLRAQLEPGGYQVVAYTYPPGTRFSRHTHGYDKKDGVLSGRFRVWGEGWDVVLEAGDYLEVPAGTPHSAEVVGDQAVVSLDASKYQR